MWVLPWSPVIGGTVVRFQHIALASGRLGLASRGGATSPFGGDIALVVVGRYVRDVGTSSGMGRGSDPLPMTSVRVIITAIPTLTVALVLITFATLNWPNSSITMTTAVATREEWRRWVG